MNASHGRDCRQFPATGTGGSLRTGALVLALLLPPQPVSAAAEAVGTFVVVEGAVTVVKPGFDNRAPARSGDQLLVGEIVKTGENSRAKFLLRDDSLVIVFPRSELRVNQFAFDPAANRRTSRIQLLDGSARFVVDSKRLKNSLFSVETAHAATFATRADYLLFVSADDTRLAVLEGGISAKNTSALVVGNASVRANQEVVIARNKPPSQPASVTPARRKEYRTF